MGLLESAEDYLDSDQMEMIDDIESYIKQNFKLKGNAEKAVQGIMNSTYGDMDELEMNYNRGGVKAGVEYIMSTLPKAAVRKYINESLESLNEGQFSWFTQDTDQQIGSERENTITVYMYDNEGNRYKEDKYEGYGVFGGMDYFELLAKMNGYSEEDLESVKGPFKEVRQLGIDLAYGKLKTKNKNRQLLFPALVEDPRYNWKRHDFTEAPADDPNQSWYVEPEDDYDDYDDDYYDDSYESYVPNFKTFLNEKLNK